MTRGSELLARGTGIMGMPAHEADRLDTEDDAFGVSPEERLAFAKAVQDAAEEERSHENPAEPTVIDGKTVIWYPQAGSQTAFLSCPFFEALYQGSRGGGKTDALVMSFAQHVGQGHGEAWRGIIFRQTYPQLADVVAKSQKWFKRIFPDAEFNQGRMEWAFAGGEVLMFRHIQRPADYWNYHGHELPFIGFEELTNWPDAKCYTQMFSCCRTAKMGVPRMIRATTNPYGPGHGWVKDRFKLAGRWDELIVLQDNHDDDGNPEPDRCAIHSHVSENKILLAADPTYEQTIRASAGGNAAMAEAWLSGSWDIVAGGMFDDVWTHGVNNVGMFDVPESWKIDRAFDWGSSKPFSVGWYAQSDGSDLEMRDGRIVSTVRGDLFRIAEWYGYTGKPDQGLRMLAVEVAEGIVEREILLGWREGRTTRVKAGPADSAIYTVENGMSIAVDMAKAVRVNGRMYSGVTWIPADKRSGSRVMGWEMVRKMMTHAKRPEDGIRERPGFFVIGERNEQFLRTMLALPRSEKNPDDVETSAEDHIGDEVRYKVRSVGAEMKSGRTIGMT